jgi:hypothetical protein
MTLPLLDEKTRAAEALAHKDAISDLLETGLSDDNIKAIRGVTKVDFTAKDDAKLPVAPSVVLLKGVRHMLRWPRKARSVTQGFIPHKRFWFIVSLITLAYFQLEMCITTFFTTYYPET